MALTHAKKKKASKNQTVKYKCEDKQQNWSILGNSEDFLP